MRVLFCAMRWDYKQPARGDSFEYTNFWDSLRHQPGVEAKLFPFDEMESKLGREGMNRALLKKVEDGRFDLVFFFMFTDEFLPDVIDQVTAKTTTVNWFADDQWRFDTYSRHWAPHLTWVATTYGPAADGFRRLGFRNIIRTQWGCNHHRYRPLEISRDLNVTFVGQPHGDRRRIINRLRAEGIDVRAWGFGWPSGKLSQDQMIEVFSRSKINLNLSNASLGMRTLLGAVLQKKGGLVVPRSPASVYRNLKEFRAKRYDQIKGRNFEIPGCKTFMLTAEVEGLDEYFEPGKEIATFTTFEDLIEKIRHYLEAMDEREAIAKAGYERILACHTYEARFQEMFRKMGFT